MIRIPGIVVIAIAAGVCWYLANANNTTIIRDESHRHYMTHYEAPFEKTWERMREEARRVIHESKSKVVTVPLLTPHECALIVFEAERRTKDRGWTTKRHMGYPTTDVPLSDLPMGNTLVLHRVHRRIIPKIEAVFEFDGEFVDVNDLFLIRYTAGRQDSLSCHKDGSLFSFIVPLNDAFEGGGTQLPCEGGDVMKPDVGHAIVFCGQQMHRGLPVTRGTRYVLAGFLREMIKDDACKLSPSTLKDA